MAATLSNKDVASKSRWTAKQLLETKFPDLDWIVPGLLPEGMTILGGRPKVGKSWLAMQIARSMGSGDCIFGNPVTRGKVFYLALEDTARRLARRLTMQHWPKTCDCTFERSWRPLNKGGLDDLANEFKHNQYRLMVIDTISRAIEVRDHNDLSSMTKAYDSIQKFLDEHNCSALIIDHLSKMGDSDNFDPIENVISSTAKVAVADTIIALSRKRGQHETILRSSSREADELDMKIKLDKETMLWTLADAVLREGSMQNKIVQYAAQKEGEPIYVGEVAKALGRDKGQVAREMGELVEKQILSVGEKQGVHVPYMLIDHSVGGLMFMLPSKK